MKMKDLMVDLETVGKDHNAAMFSISAVEFDLANGATGREFEVHIDLDSSLREGFEVSGSTIYWWLTQSDAARKALVEGKRFTIQQVLTSFSRFCSGQNYRPWGNSARFDLGILQNAYNRLNYELPWDYRKEMDVRTLVALRPKIKRVYGGVSHRGIDDCYSQIDHCCRVYKDINP